MSALGAITIQHVYFTCTACKQGGYSADAKLGIDGFLTAQARRLVCLAGGQRSFENAEMPLKELCGWHISDERIRQACHAEADLIARWRPEAPTGFSPTADACEFQTDATKVNTTEGWKDLKIGVFCHRKAGPASSLDDWKQRKLPKPTTRLAFGAIEEIEHFGPRWSVWAEKLGLKSFEKFSVIGDGAEWIWNAAAEQFPGHRGVLDIFHASEHLAATADALHGKGSDASRAWFEAARTALLGDGWYGIQEQIGRTLTEPLSDAGREAVEALTRYLANHSTRLNYRLHLARGEPIGSGLIEGACKQMIGRRMKQTGACWTVPNANRMAELCSLTYSDQWNDYWLAI
jgi:hypothetical protein